MNPAQKWPSNRDTLHSAHSLTSYSINNGTDPLVLAVFTTEIQVFFKWITFSHGET